MRFRKWLWGLAALPLVGLPLIAQESAPPEPPAAQPAAAPPAPGDEKSAEPAAADDETDAASSEAQRPADERMSADNNLSFPVDI